MSTSNENTSTQPQRNHQQEEQYDEIASNSSSQVDSTRSATPGKQTLAEYLTDEQLNNNDELRHALNGKPTHAFLSLVLHCAMLKRGFRCVGLSENDAQTRELPKTQILPPEGWLNNQDVWHFRYKHSQSSMTFVLKCMMLGNRLLVNAIAVEDNNEYYQMEINIDQYVDKSKVSDYLQHQNHVQFIDIFKNLNELESNFLTQIQNSLVPKPGYESQSTSSTSSSSRAQNTTQSQPPPPPPPSQTQPPYYGDEDFDDPLRIGPPRRPQPTSTYPPQPQPPGFFGFGEDDLYPSGAPPSPFGPHGRRPGFGGGGGNQIGPHHPGFFQPYPPSGGARPGASGGGVPPGARFDPVYPHAPLGYGQRNRRNQQGHTSNQQPHQQDQFYGEPNPDHMRPPRDLDDDDDNIRDEMFM